MMKQIGWADPNAKDRHVYKDEAVGLVPVYVEDQADLSPTALSRRVHVRRISTGECVESCGHADHDTLNADLREALHRYSVGPDWTRAEVLKLVQRLTDIKGVTIGRNQFDLLTGALDGLLRLLVVDPDADVPEVKDPWAENPPVEVGGKRIADYGPVWNAINQAIVVRRASARWLYEAGQQRAAERAHRVRDMREA